MKRREFLAGSLAGAGLLAAAGGAGAQTPTFRVPDLCLLDPSGKLTSTADMRGKALFLHWWGSWCPPCKRELPELAWLESELKGREDIRFVFMNGLEHNDRSLAFLKANNHQVSQYNSLNMSRQERNMYRTNGEPVSLNQLGITLYPQTWIADRSGLVLRGFSGENLNWRLWKSFVEDAPRKPWDGKTLAPAESLGWANGEYAGRLLGGEEGGSDRSRRIRIRVEPGGPDGQAKISAQWLPPGAPPGNLRAVVATADSVTLAGTFSNGNSLRAVATREGLGGVFQYGKRTTLDRIEMKKATA